MIYFYLLPLVAHLPSETVIEQLLFLKNNIEPWNTVLEYWHATCNERQSEIQSKLSTADILSKYACFESDKCLQLVQTKHIHFFY